MLNLIIAATQAILQVMTIVLLGFLLTRMGLFNMERQKWLSQLNMVFFTPCLLFSNIAQIISFEKLLAFWPIPMFYFSFSLLSFIVSQTTTRALNLNPASRRFVLACVMFSNTNSLPIATISSLAVSEAGRILFWGQGDTPEAVAARGISYTLFYAVFGNLVRWSYGYNLLSHHPGDLPEMSSKAVSPPQDPVLPHIGHDTTYCATKRRSSSSTVSTASGVSDLGQEEQQFGGMPRRDLSALTLAPPVQVNRLSPSSSATQLADETTSLLSPKAYPPPQSQSWWIRAARKIHSFMSPPLYAALMALIVGLSPLKSVLYRPDSFLYPSFSKAIETCGKAAVPIILSCLGAQLACILESSQSTSRGTVKPVAAATGVRMLLMPLFCVPLVVAFVHYGSRWSTLATDPVFIVMMIVLGCAPTAINLVQITQVNGIFEEEMLRMLFWSYGIVCVPVCTITVFVALGIVDRLL